MIINGGDAYQLVLKALFEGNLVSKFQGAFGSDSRNYVRFPFFPASENSHQYCSAVCQIHERGYRKNVGRVE